MKQITKDGRMIELKMCKTPATESESFHPPRRAATEITWYWVEYRTRGAFKLKMTGAFTELPLTRTRDCDDCANVMYDMMRGIQAGHATDYLADIKWDK